MKVIIENEVFATASNALALAHIAHLAAIGKHRLEIQDDTSREFTAWLSGLGLQLQEQWEEILEQSALVEAFEPARRVVRIANVPQSTWTGSVPRLNTKDAVTFLGKPFRILVEDETSDGSFILAIATEQQKQKLKELLGQGFARLEHGGGIGSMTVRIKALAATPDEARLYWAMFDSDALQPGAPSGNSNRLRDACTSLGIPHHQLSRRYIESYIPRTALNAWAYNTPRMKAMRVPVLNAFLQLTDAQRHHYNIKHGFNGDAPRATDSGNLYNGLSAALLPALAGGFGSDVWELCAPACTDEGFRRDGCSAEFFPKITELLALMR